MPDPTCPHEDCTETVTHWHNADDPEIGCYAPRTQPAPLTAILAAAEDAKRAHDRLCDLAETLLPESSPVKTADNPAPIVLPTVDEVENAWRAVIARGERTRDAAQAVLDLIAARVPAWVPVEPGTVIKAGTHYRIEWDGDDPSSAGWAFATERCSSFDFTPCPTDPGRYSIDPRTVPAEPEDPRVAAIAEVLEDEYGSVSEDAEYDPREYHQAAIDEILAKLDGLARLDAARADQ